MVEIRRYTTNDKQRWDEFVALSKNATFLHYRDYMDYHSDRFNDHSLMAFNEKGKLIALLPANADGDTLYSHQGLTFGGWLTQVKHFNANNMLEIFDSMCDYLKANGFRTLIYKATPHIFHRYPAEEDIYALFRHKAEILATNLSSTVDQRSSLRMFNRRAKRTIERAKNAGVTVAASEDYATFWKILSDNLNNKYGASPVHTLDEILLLHERFPEHIKLYMSYIEGEAVAGAVIFEYGDVAHAQYSSANEKGSENGALGYLFSELVSNIYNHVRLFDFGTSNENGGLVLNENLIEMKSGYGARGIAFNIYKLEL